MAAHRWRDVRAAAGRWRDWWGTAALAAVCYVPLLFQGRGRLAADTRQAVYLDPGRFLADALSMWDPSRDLGTVTHQNIVLVWPMGVFYRGAELVGLPLWLAQRLWLGSILFLAGAGVLYLARTLRWGVSGAAGPLVAALAYAMSPYVLQYGTRTSVLLLPWAALPWLIGLTARALGTGGWRHPALIALVTGSIAVNATALALALLGPGLWVLWAVLGIRTVPWRAAVATVARVAVLGVPTALWWVVALLIERRHGMPLLSYTETIEQVASTSSATEVLRGLGYWVPYLEQHGYREVTGSAFYLETFPVLVIQFAAVLVAFAAVVTVRAPHRTFFAGLVAVGVVIGVGAYPPTDGSPLSSLFSDLAREGGIGLALRSTTRAAPIALLGLAVLLGAFVDAVVERAATAGRVLGAALVLVAVALSPSVGAGDLVDPLFSRPEQLPDHWTSALAAADERAGSGRLLEIPGIRFASYRWGTTYEPITAGLAETPTAWREQIPYGGPGSADVLVALDNRVQEGRLDPSALAPMSRLLGASQVLVRNDLAYERYGTTAPDRVWRVASSGAEGLGPPAAFGRVGTNRPDPPVARDDMPVPDDPDATYPPVALVPVEDSPGLVQLLPVSGTVVLDGDAHGIVDAAAAGLVDGRAPVLEAAATIGHGDLLDLVLAEGAPIVLTDTNRRRVQRWRHIENTQGVTLRADQDPALDDGKDGGEAALDVFPGAGTAWQTVAEHAGAKVSASRYGNPIWFERGLRPAAALDGDRNTGWQVGPDIGGIGDTLTIELPRPVTADRVAISGSRGTTHLSAVVLRFDGERPERFDLSPASRAPGGQVLRFPARRFRTLTVELAGKTDSVPGVGPGSFGIDEVDLRRADGRPVRVGETMRMPSALVGRLGHRSVANPLAVVLTRQRGDVDDPRIFGEERTIARELSLPTDRTFTLGGRVRPRVGLAGEVLGPRPAPGPCRDDLLAVDGRPVPVRVGGPAEDAAGEAAFVSGCAPVTLSAGPHRVTASADADFDIDQLVLASAAGGGPAPVGAGRQPVAPPAPRRLPLDWERLSSSRVDVAVRPTPAGGPAWLFFAESRSDGWSAEADGAGDLGSPVLLNGFGNGWLVPDPDAAGEVALRWEPQRRMDLAVLVTALAALVALVLAVRGRRWAPGVERVDGPALEAPWLLRPRVGGLRLVLTSTLLAAAGAAVIGPGAGVMVAVATLLAGRWRRGHVVLAGGAVAALAVSLGWVVLDRFDEQATHPYTFFTALHGQHRAAMLAIALLAADLLLARVRRPGKARGS